MVSIFFISVHSIYFVLMLPTNGLDRLSLLLPLVPLVFLQIFIQDFSFSVSFVNVFGSVMSSSIVSTVHISKPNLEILLNKQTFTPGPDHC